MNSRFGSEETQESDGIQFPLSLSRLYIINPVLMLYLTNLNLTRYQDARRKCMGNEAYEVTNI